MKSDVFFIKSQQVTNEFLISNNKHFFIIANFMLLSESSKKYIQDNIKYVILEHDHKYCSTNNPSIFSEFIVPEHFLINQNFYKNAYAVLCQTSMHCKIIEKNLFLNNLINLSCNLWSEKEIKLLKELLHTKKEYKHSIFSTSNKNKGTEKAKNYCLKNNISFHEIIHSEQEKFLNEIAKSETIIFMPNWVETFSRVTIESRILGCKLITNNLIGCMKEPFFEKKGEDLLNYITNYRHTLKNIYLSLINENIDSKLFFKSFELPKASIITTFLNAKKYIKNFMEAIVRQTYFKNTEFIIIDAGSDENEYEIIKNYLHNNNIKYYRLDEKKSISECFNIAIEKSSSDYIGFVCVDDIMSDDHVEILTRNLYNNKHIDLMYGDCLQTNLENETVELNTSNHYLYQHSLNDFSKENMIKCLPGPMPMFTKRMIEKNGNFDVSLNFANDWELWLRCVNNGCQFKKVNFISGLYYNNPHGQSTSQKKMTQKRLEEKLVFNKYKNVFPKNYEIYKNYFNSIN